MKHPKIEDHHSDIPISGMENKKLPESNQNLSIFPKTLQLTLFLIQECRNYCPQDHQTGEMDWLQNQRRLASLLLGNKPTGGSFLQF